MDDKEKKLEVRNLVISFKTDNGLVRAVRDVSFDLYKGETLCIVGESGSGKSVTSKAIMGILSANAIVENGTIMFEGENILEVSEEEMHRIRGHKIGMIFQDPLSSLNPIVRIGKQITEAMLINSDKLKLMFNDLISEELVAYKNEIAKERINIKKAKDELAVVKYQSFNGIDKNDKEALKAANEAVKAQKIKTKQDIDKAKAELKANLPVLSDNLNKKKKEAKAIVKEHADKLYKEYQEKVENAKNTIQDKEALNQELARLKEEYTDQIKITQAAAKKKAIEVMKEVGIPMPEKRFKQYPFEFSGGMRQRIVIAIALTAAPDILICDEPTTALDVTIQAQILELIKKIQAERNISCIFITHDLGVVANMADRVAVMYAGKIVEYGTSEEIFFDPRHPYTWALLSSIPDVDSKEKLEAIQGTPPNMIYPPKGDAFAPRSKYAMKIDFEKEPPMFKVSDTHYAKTWLLHKDAPKVEMPKIVSERIKNALNNQEKEANTNE